MDRDLVLALALGGIAVVIRAHELRADVGEVLLSHGIDVVNVDVDEVPGHLAVPDKRPYHCRAVASHSKNGDVHRDHAGLVRPCLLSLQEKPAAVLPEDPVDKRLGFVDPAHTELSCRCHGQLALHAVRKDVQFSVFAASEFLHKLHGLGNVIALVAAHCKDRDLSGGAVTGEVHCQNVLLEADRSHGSCCVEKLSRYLVISEENISKNYHRPAVIFAEVLRKSQRALI